MWENRKVSHKIRMFSKIRVIKVVFDITRIDLVGKEKPPYCQNSLCLSSKKPNWFSGTRWRKCRATFAIEL